MAPSSDVDGLVGPPRGRRTGDSGPAQFHTPGFEKDRVESQRDEETVRTEKKELQQVIDAEPEMERARSKFENEDFAEADESAGEVQGKLGRGTLLEGAFVDPAYPWPPIDGQGKNAIELQASMKLLSKDDEISVGTTDTLKERMRMPKMPVVPKKKWYQCCKSDEAVDSYNQRKKEAESARKEYAALRKKKLKSKERQVRQQQRYNRVPEGILIYRLDTTTHRMTLMSAPHSNTNMDTLIRDVTVARASASVDKSRRGMDLVDIHGNEMQMVACEQRTATAWLEAMNLMLAKEERKRGRLGSKFPKRKSAWSKEQLKDKELDTIEDEYMNLANYSNKLIRAGALPGGKKGSGGAGGIYYTVEKVNDDAWDDEEEEALEAVAKRRAVIKDSWDFYRMICSLLRDRNKYDEVFRRMQLDPVYPYLNSMTGLNDPGETGYHNPDKQVMQPEEPEYANMSRMGLAQALVMQAEAAMPSLVEICKALAGSLGMEEVGVGPIKDTGAAMRKAEKKYDGDLLKITDYCRAMLVVKDFPSLLALLELARDSFGPLIRRVKMNSLKSSQKSKIGGYRDCIINVELKDHICEIQVHLWPMWTVCGVDGFRHYRHCVEYTTDSFEDAYEALDGLDRKTRAELIVMAEEAVAETPLDNLEWYHEKYILDYFAEAGLFMKHGLDVWAEITFRHLIRLRTESPDIGPDHHETMVLRKYLAQSLKAQDKHEEASRVAEQVKSYEKAQKKEKIEAEQSVWDSFMSAPSDAYDMIMDPNRKEREEEETARKEVKGSKKKWRKIRQERFPFLDTDVTKAKNDAARQATSDEKKTEAM